MRDTSGRWPRIDRVSESTPEFRVDVVRAQAAVREFLLAIGEDPDRDGLRETPARVAKAAGELFSGMGQDPAEILATTFDMSHDEMVLVRDIEVHSFCEHHLLPFIGVAHVAYIPARNGRVTGLSKIARLVDVYARRPQVQERLTTQVADAMMECLDARGVMVVVECEHMCMTLRGIRKSGARTITSAVRGIMKDSHSGRGDGTHHRRTLTLRWIGTPGKEPGLATAGRIRLGTVNSWPCVVSG